MRRFLPVCLMLLFAWNTVLGGTGVLVLCLHDQGDVHMELASRSWVHETRGAETQFVEMDCPPCKDILLGSVELGIARLNELVSFDVPAFPLVSRVEGTPEFDFRPGKPIANLYPKRGPPDVESLSEWIRRVIVMRV